MRVRSYVIRWDSVLHRRRRHHQFLFVHWAIGHSVELVAVVAELDTVAAAGPTFVVAFERHHDLNSILRIGPIAGIG